MSATSDLKKYIKSMNYSEIDKVYQINIPIEDQDIVDTNTILITEAIMENDDYSDNGFHSIIQTLEVQVFYALHPDFDTEEFEIKFMKDLENGEWRTVRSDPHIIDPDTNQTVKLFYFERVKYI